jgi:hypothetical protein
MSDRHFSSLRATTTRLRRPVASATPRALRTRHIAETIDDRTFRTGRPAT